MPKALEDMSIHELRTKRDEVWAELEAVEARMRELAQFGPLEPPIGSSRSVQSRRINNPELPLVTEQATTEPGPSPGPNAHPEGEDAP